MNENIFGCFVPFGMRNFYRWMNIFSRFIHSRIKTISESHFTIHNEKRTLNCNKSISTVDTSDLHSTSHKKKKTNAHTHTTFDWNWNQRKWTNTQNQCNHNYHPKQLIPIVHMNEPQSCDRSYAWLMCFMFLFWFSKNVNNK